MECQDAGRWNQFDPHTTGHVACGQCREDDRDAAIETLRVMLLEHAAGQASAVRETRVDPWSNSEDTTDLEHGACIAIALALLL